MNMISTLGKVATIMLSTATACLGASRTLSSGDQVNWDGTYYDYRAADGKAMVKMWVPPSATCAKNAILSPWGEKVGATICARASVNSRLEPVDGSSTVKMKLLCAVV